MEKILLAIDDSEQNKKALTKTRELAGSLEAKITLLTVIREIKVGPEEPAAASTPEKSTPSPRQIKRSQQKMELEKEGQEILDEAASLFQEQEIETEKVMLTGNPADEICRYADEEDFDLIILADKGRGGITRFLLGSTSEKVLRHAQTSVLVVK